MDFKAAVSLLEKIEQAQGRLVITGYLAEMFAQATAQEASFLAYFLLGGLYPPYHNQQFNLAQKSVQKALARYLERDEKDVAQEVKAAGDIGHYVAEQFVRNNHDARVAAPLSVTILRDRLHALLKLSGVGSQEAKQEQLKQLFDQVTACEARYIVRCLVGKLRLGFSDMTLLDAYSWMMRGDKSLRAPLETAYNLCADIGRVISVLKSGGIEAVRELTLTPGIPVRPAAAERLNNAQAIVDKLGVCVAQPKFDGFRVQVHKWVDQETGQVQVRFFSRNLRDMTGMFPEIEHEVRAMPVDSIVFEGEAIVFDEQTGRHLPFQETVRRKRKHGVAALSEELPLRLYIFDVLYLAGRSVLSLSHTQRRDALESTVYRAWSSEVVSMIEEREITTGDDLAYYFDEAMSSGLEGLVVKRPDMPYQPGSRNFNWIKLKRQETGSLDDTLDCVILGYYYGRGKRASFGIGAFLVGVYNPATECIQTMAKVGTGLSDQEWRELRERCDALSRTDKPDSVQCSPHLFCDVWVEPEIICQIRADEITLSPIHTTQVTDDGPAYGLRFPRFMGYRPDKDVQLTTTPREVAQLYGLQVSGK